MKKTITILLLFTALVLGITACAETILDTQTTLPTEPTTTTTQTTEPATIQTVRTVATATLTAPQEIIRGPILGDRYLDNSMPVLIFRAVDDDVYPCEKITQSFVKEMSTGGILGVISEYLGYESLNDWIDFSVTPCFTGLMDWYSDFAVIMKYNIPDEVIIRGVERHNNFYDSIYSGLSLEELKLIKADIKYLTDNDIKVLLSRCEATVLKHFTSPYAIVVHDRVYSPAWLYRNTVEGYKAAGITPQMIQEKLPLWGEIGFYGEPAVAFEAKLSEFTGRDVVLRAQSE
jgi:hypothetical protein